MNWRERAKARENLIENIEDACFDMLDKISDESAPAVDAVLSAAIAELIRARAGLIAEVAATEHLER